MHASSDAGKSAPKKVFVKVLEMLGIVESSQWVGETFMRFALLYLIASILSDITSASVTINVQGRLSVAAHAIPVCLSSPSVESTTTIVRNVHRAPYPEHNFVPPFIRRSNADTS